MKHLQELHRIMSKQKSMRSGRLIEYIKKISKEIVYMQVKIKSQQKTIEHLNKGHNHQKNRADRLQKKLDKMLVSSKEN